MIASLIAGMYVTATTGGPDEGLDTVTSAQSITTDSNQLVELSDSHCVAALRK